MERIFFEQVPALQGLGAGPELFDESLEAVHQGPAQRGFIDLVPDVELRPALEQPVDDLGPASLGDIKKRRRPLLVDGMDVGAVLDQDVEEPENAASWSGVC
jgi:hypothetical protein